MTIRSCTAPPRGGSRRFLELAIPPRPPVSPGSLAPWIYKPRLFLCGFCQPNPNRLCAWPVSYLPPSTPRLGWAGAASYVSTSQEEPWPRLLRETEAVPCKHCASRKSECLKTRDPTTLYLLNTHFLQKSFGCYSPGWYRNPSSST